MFPNAPHCSVSSSSSPVFSTPYPVSRKAPVFRNAGLSGSPRKAPVFRNAGLSGSRRGRVSFSPHWADSPPTSRPNAPGSSSRSRGGDYGLAVTWIVRPSNSPVRYGWTAAAAGADGVPVKKPAAKKEKEQMKILSTIAELQEKLQRKLEEKLASMEEEGEDSDAEEEDEDEEEEEEGNGTGEKKKKKKKRKKTVVASQGQAVLGQEGGVESVVQEYKLSEKGVLSTVTLTVGDTTHHTRSQLDEVVGEVRVWAHAGYAMVRNFSLRRFVEELRTNKETGLEDLKFNAAMYAPKAGISNISQWTATELTLQRASMQRIARDTLYLIWAFNLFGAVRILEAVIAVFSTSPPSYKKIFDALNALDPLTIASLAGGLREPVLGMLDVDPTDLEGVCGLRAKFWSELHKFYERQWKVMATLGVARLLTLIVSRLPAAEWVTKKVKVIWDITMALPIF